MNQSKKLFEILQVGKKRLKEAKADQFALDAELFMMYAFHCSKIELFTRDQEYLPEKVENLFWEMIDKREAGIPTQYILGECEFMGLPIHVNSSVLIPRPDTEILVETVLEYHKKENLSSVLEIGTGSGCIAISLAYYGKCFVHGVDVSPEALKIAHENAILNGIDKNITWILSDLFDKIPENLTKSFSAIVSNPPYIRTSVIETLMREVRDQEPYLALNGGEDGLYFYREIIKKADLYLKKDGFVFFEIGFDQAEEVTALFQAEGFSEIEVRKDLAGLNRVVCARKREKVMS